MHYGGRLVSEFSKGVSNIRNNTSDGSHWMGIFAGAAAAISTYGILNMFFPANGILKNGLFLGLSFLAYSLVGEMTKRGELNPVNSIVDTSKDFANMLTGMFGGPPAPREDKVRPVLPVIDPSMAGPR